MPKSLTLDKLIDLANEAYPDSRIALNYNKKTHKATTNHHGDGLANFIVRELIDTFDPKALVEQQRKEAGRALSLASREIESVALKLSHSI